MVTCPIECVKDNPDFIERNGAWLLSVIASSSALFGYLLSYLLKSRCKKIDCWGLKCDRTPIDLDSSDQHRLWIRQVRAQTCDCKCVGMLRRLRQRVAYFFAWAV